MVVPLRANIGRSLIGSRCYWPRGPRAQTPFPNSQVPLSRRTSIFLIITFPTDVQDDSLSSPDERFKLRPHPGLQTLSNCDLAFALARCCLLPHFVPLRRFFVARSSRLDFQDDLLSNFEGRFRPLPALQTLAIFDLSFALACCCLLPHHVPIKYIFEAYFLCRLHLLF